ncbi:MAG: conjugative transfer signal peptidase TraF [Acidobacteriota bacterium]
MTKPPTGPEGRDELFRAVLGSLRFRHAVFGLMAVLFVAWMAADRSGVRYNHTESKPRGFYQEVEGRAEALELGQLVAVCPPAKVAQWGLEAGYYRKSLGSDCPESAMPTLKHVVALEGDRVEVQSGAVLVNGVELAKSARLARDRNGREVPGIAPGVYPVEQGQMWLLLDHERSFDSRYYGPVPTRDFVAVMKPLLTFGNAESSREKEGRDVQRFE